MTTPTADSRLLDQARAGLPLGDFAIYDVHTHTEPGLSIASIKNSAAELVAELDVLGIRAAMVSSVPGIFGMTRYGNDSAIRSQREFSGRLHGYMILDPASPDAALAEMHYAWENGLRGLKIYSTSVVKGLAYNHPNYDPIYAQADAWGLPVLVHTWGRPDLDPLAPAIARYPNISWLLAHTGSQDMDRYIELAKAHPSMHLELCFSGCTRGLVEHLVAHVGAERILWGSDQLFFSAAHQLGRVIFAQISYEAKRRILGENAVKLMPFLAS